MPDPTPLTRVLCGEPVFDRDTDSRILQAANEMSARLLFELFLRADTDTAEGARAFAEKLGGYCIGDPTALLGFADGRDFGREVTAEEAAALAEEESAATHECYLRLEFTTPEASFYQFHLFPPMTEPFIRGASRKREAQFQHLRIDLSRPGDIQPFIQSLRRNPHLVKVHDSSEEEFRQAPSHSI